MPDNTIISYANFSTINVNEPPVSIKTASSSVKLDIDYRFYKIIDLLG
ncbi:hypothetical protein [Clostridium tyrobutyricum]|nr:hypothetical protein [Clostridium tyrobutyricum]MBV4439744.1 hypothetical protein [Clostridium tyrobutyricum]